MKMTSRVLIYAIAILLTFVFVSCVVSEISWSTKENNADSLTLHCGFAECSGWKS